MLPAIPFIQTPVLLGKVIYVITHTVYDSLTIIKPLEIKNKKQKTLHNCITAF